ncbi:hypothetical protein O181_040878 [Austropuccinia psidii MF-1]|uniref:Smr domain-containing protein n=1 Tax=Austropuccinia psidii MF-1 TaxID=1389203 RepID=A0A9Q3DI37_9BASI|nr:hypothetical protein [Austropuccinia psidii MF-1]
MLLGTHRFVQEHLGSSEIGNGMLSYCDADLKDDNCMRKVKLNATSRSNPMHQAPKRSSGMFPIEFLQMAFGIRNLIKFAQKLKLIWDKQQDEQPDEPIPQLGGHQPHQNQNQTNSLNPHYVGLRNKALEENRLMKQKFDESKQAYTSRDGARAKVLSNEGKAHQQRRDDLNRQAAEWIFRENNRHSPSDTIDLHGLYVYESISYMEAFISEASRARKHSILRVIVGKGNHSQNNQARLKPAIEKLVKQHSLAVSLDEQNSGVLIVELGVSHERRGIDRRIQDIFSKNRNSCIVM